MKDNCSSFDFWWILLYIPHGSDESETLVTVVFYIKSLYIPHGSDESVSGSATPDEIFIFISHMVQMKEKH